MNKYSVVCCFLLALVSNARAGYEDCGSKIGEAVSIVVSGCPDPDTRCILPRNKEASLTVEFNLKQDVVNVTNVVHGIILGVELPFQLPQPNACEKGMLDCPLKAGGPYKFKITLPVEKKYPKVIVDVKWEIRDENGDDIICTIIPAKIM